jgi:hypothetical protein
MKDFEMNLLESIRDSLAVIAERLHERNELQRAALEMQREQLELQRDSTRAFETAVGAKKTP